MQKLIIEQGGPLRGRVRVNGAKNAVLPIMAACLLCDDESVIERVPQVTDVRIMSGILRRLGVAVVLSGDRVSIRAMIPVLTIAQGVSLILLAQATDFLGALAFALLWGFGIQMTGTISCVILRW